MPSLLFQRNNSELKGEMVLEGKPLMNYLYMSNQFFVYLILSVVYPQFDEDQTDNKASYPKCFI